MPFEKEIRDTILAYCMCDLPNDIWYENAFDFVKDSSLKARLISEFKNARFIYKMFEGLAAEDELLLAEVKMQVLMYASIHLHAELKKEIDYHLALSKIAYRRMQPFLNQIRTKLNTDGLL